MFELSMLIGTLILMGSMALYCYTNTKEDNIKVPTPEEEFRKRHGSRHIMIFKEFQDNSIGSSKYARCETCHSKYEDVTNYSF